MKVIMTQLQELSSGNHIVIACESYRAARMTAADIREHAAALDMVDVSVFADDDSIVIYKGLLPRDPSPRYTFGTYYELQTVGGQIHYGLLWYEQKDNELNAHDFYQLHVHNAAVVIRFKQSDIKGMRYSLTRDYVRCIILKEADIKVEDYR